jgi:methyl-accepting chemotaxis protein
MDQGTQQNAALVEQVAAAAQSLQEQSAHLARAVDRFKIAPDLAPAAAGSRAASPGRTPPALKLVHTRPETGRRVPA